MELKSWFQFVIHKLVDGSNRTFMELKLLV